MTAPVSTLPPDFADLGFGLNAQRRVLLVADMGESVRLMQRHEWETTQRWRSLVQTLVQDVLPAHQGTLVQRRGDGLMLEFESVTGAAAAAFECHRRADAANQGRPGDQHIVLRMGLHQAEVLADGIDLYGAGVQLTHRLAALAQRGETLCTAEVRDELTDGLHASVCDKGERLLPGLEDPVRVYQLQPVGDAPRHLLRWAPESLLPRVAFVAAQSYANPEEQAVCQMVVTELTAAASRVNLWRVISSLTTRQWSSAEITNIAHATGRQWTDYVVSIDTSYAFQSGITSLRCTDARSGTIVWEQIYSVPIGAWLAINEGLSAEVSRCLASALLAHEIRVTHTSALHSLPSYALLISAVGLTHKTAASASAKAGQILEHLAQRHPRSAEVLFCLGNYIFLSGLHGFVPLDRVPTASISYLSSAMDIDNEHAGSAGLRSHISELFRLQNDTEVSTASQLAHRFPNNADIWYYASCSEADPNSKDPGFSIQCAHNAIDASPTDPQLPLRHASLAFAHFRAHQISEALTHAEASHRLNATHLPGLALLIACYWEIGKPEAAKRVACEYLAIRPKARVEAFVKNRGDDPTSLTQRLANALNSAGIP